MRAMKTEIGRTTRATGNVAEDAATRFLERNGWRVIDRNVRRREGEIDLIGLDERTLVFVEVKSLRTSGSAPPFSPLESIGARKTEKVRTLARYWLIDELRRYELHDPLYFSSIRFDAVGVTLDQGGEVLDIAHVKEAF